MQNSCQHCARRASTSTSPDRRASTPAREAPLLPGPGSCGQPRASTPTGTARAGARGCAGRPVLRAGQPQTRQRERENRDNHPHPGPSRRVRQSAARRRVLGKATGQGDNGTLPRSRAATPARDNRGSVARGRTRPARCPSRGKPGRVTPPEAAFGRAGIIVLWLAAGYGCCPGSGLLAALPWANSQAPLEGTIPPVSGLDQGCVICRRSSQPHPPGALRRTHSGR